MRNLIAVTAAVSIICIAARHQDSPKTEALEKRVAALEERVATLEKKDTREFEARVAVVQAVLRPIVQGLDLYEIDNGAYPSTEQGLTALVEKPANAPKTWKQILKRVANDPWGRPYVYKCPGVKNQDAYDLCSSGPDGKDGTADDIWPEKK